MDHVVSWMAEQVCPLLPYLGLRACTTATNLYLLGVASWIFGGVGLLMLMGISEAIEERKAARRAHIAKTSHVVKLTGNAPIQQTSPNAEHPVVATRRPLHSRVRSMSRRNFGDQRADAPKRIRSAHQ